MKNIWENGATALHTECTRGIYKRVQNKQHFQTNLHVFVSYVHSQWTILEAWEYIAVMWYW